MQNENETMLLSLDSPIRAGNNSSMCWKKTENTPLAEKYNYVGVPLHSSRREYFS